VGCFWEINVSSRKNTEWEEKSTFAALRQNIELQLYERKIQERTKGKCFPILIVFLAGLKEKNEFEAWKFEELCIMVSQSAVSSCMFRCLLRWTKLVRQVLIFFFLSLSLSQFNFADLCTNNTREEVEGAGKEKLRLHFG